MTNQLLIILPGLIVAAFVALMFRAGLVTTRFLILLIGLITTAALALTLLLGLTASTALAADALPPIPPPTLDLKTVSPQKRGAATLPALGSPAQGQNTKQNIVRINEGTNEIVYVALGFPNRISTPYDNPKAIWGTNVEFTVVGRDLYVIPDQETPIGVFVTDPTGTAPTASLTLIPRPGIPGQNILLTLEGGWRKPDAPESVKNAPPSDYEDGLKKLLRQFVQGGIAAGFQEGTLRVGMARVGGILVTPEKVFTGTAFNVYRYRVENTGRDVMELNEPSFHEDGVRAVAFWPNVRIASGETTLVFIVADLPKDEEK